jgi:hypothetical protein
MGFEGNGEMGNELNKKRKSSKKLSVRLWIMGTISPIWLKLRLK